MTNDLNDHFFWRKGEGRNARRKGKRKTVGGREKRKTVGGREKRNPVGVPADLKSADKKRLDLFLCGFEIRLKRGCVSPAGPFSGLQIRRNRNATP